MTKFSTRLNGTAAYASPYKCDSSVRWFMSHGKAGNPKWRSWVTVE